MTHPAEPDWTAWTPRDIATLLFVRVGGQLLLMRKKRGLGMGKINAPGGRLEPGETPLEAAIREVQEELCVTPEAPRHRGELRFQFVDGYSLHCHVFMSDACVGEPQETAEALPLWVPVEQVPYDEMWADDVLWLPRMLAGFRFDGRFLFDGDRMVTQSIDWTDPAAPLFAELEALGIEAHTVEHAPVFTVEQARAVRVAGEPDVHVKNLFLRNKKGRMWLVTLPEDHAVDLAELGRALGAGNLSFASTARLREHLAVEPGAVTPFAARNDRGGLVTVVLERSLFEAPLVHCHPLTNDRTTALSGPALVRYLESVGHPPQPL